MPAEWLKLPSLILHERSDLSVLRSLLADLFLATFEFSLNSPALLERAKFTRAVLMSFIFFDDSQKSAEEDFSTVNVMFMFRGHGHWYMPTLPASATPISVV